MLVFRLTFAAPACAPNDVTNVKRHVTAHDVFRVRCPEIGTMLTPAVKRLF